jgi:beta-lactamase superfamily II metal-dependent hydrolase
MEKLCVRVYNVGFGDAILISVPDSDDSGRTETRHILIDVGNAYLSQEGGVGHQDYFFAPVVRDIVQVLDGRPLDLYVMTHEHYDHVQGLPYADEKVFPGEDLKQKLQVHHAWFTSSADPGYYTTHPDAKERKLELERSYQAIERFLQAAPEYEDPFVSALMLINDGLTLGALALSTDDSVSWLRGLVAEDRRWYVHRPRPDYPEDSLEGKHPFHELHLEIWAPEENTADYFHKLQPLALGVAEDAASGGKPTLIELAPPPGVDAGVFYDLVEGRRQGFWDNLLAIDKAANNTSIVLLLEWRGWKLLFTGDAEQESWRMMKKQGVLQSVHFLKVSHHGSFNGMPPGELLDGVLPGEQKVDPDDGKPRYAVVSTRTGTYSNNPTPETLEKLKERCELYSTETDLDEGQWYIDLEFEGWGNEVTVRKG